MCHSSAGPVQQEQVIRRLNIQTDKSHHCVYQEEELVPVPGFGFLPPRVVRKAEDIFQV